MPKKLGKAHITEKSIRVPVSRRSCAPNSQRNVTYSKKKGIKALICCPAGQYKGGKCQDGMLTRTVIYDKDKWSKSKAEQHAQRKFL